MIKIISPMKKIKNLCLRNNKEPKRNIRQPVRYQNYYTEADREYEGGREAVLTYVEVMQSSDKNLWKNALEEEKKSLEKNNAWESVKPEEIRRKEVITSRLILKIKNDGRYKARLVARGFQQTQDVDFKEIFSPVVDTNTLRLLLAVSVQMNYKIFKFDVKTTFFYEELEEPVFMKIPQGYKEEGKICKHKKALYGFRQTPLKWNQCLTRLLKEKGLS